MITQIKLQTEEYKETELGLLPKEWEVKNFKNCIIKQRVNIGKIKQQKYKKIGKFPVVDQGQNLIAGYWDDEKDVYQGDLPIIIFGDHTRIIKFIDFLFVVGADGTKVLLPNTSVIFPRFFYYALLTLKIPSRGYNRHYSLLREKKIPLPPLPEQKSIAFVLSTIQTAKEKTEQVIKATKELKKSMMKHLFTYGPVSLEEAEKVKLKETEIGMIPEEWDIKKWGEIGKFQYGYTETASTSEIGPKFLRITDIDLSSNQINWFSVPYCKISNEDYSKYSLRNGDILIARIGATTGKTCMITECPKSVFASYLIRFTIKRDNANPQFVYYFTISEKYWKQINAGKEGKLKKGVNSNQLNKFLISLPPLPTQQKIASILSVIDEKIQAEENKKKALEDLFKSMLHNLMTAKIRVKDLNVEVENV